MGEIIEKRRRYYSGLNADKASIPASGKAVGDRYYATDTLVEFTWTGAAWVPLGDDTVDAGMIKTDAVETLKIKDLNVTLGKAALGFGRFVSRAVDAADYAVGTPFVLDGNWYEDQLNTTAIVPAGATAVLFRFYMRATAAGVGGYIRRSVASGHNSMVVITQVANVFLGAFHGIIPCDADRLFDCRFFANIDFLDVAIMGWFI